MRIGLVQAARAAALASLWVAGCGGGSAPPAAVAPPTTPAGLTLTVLSSTALSLDWAASTGGTGAISYEVVRDGTSGGIAATPPWVDRNLQPATTYAYQVRARDAAARFSASASVSGQTLAPTLYQVYVTSWLPLDAACDLYNPSACGNLTLVGSGRSTATFQAGGMAYLISVTQPERVQVDAIQFSDGSTPTSILFQGNIEEVMSMTGPPDGVSAVIGHCSGCPPGFWGGYLGGYALVRPVTDSTSITVVVGT